MDAKKCAEKYVYRICIIVLTSAVAKFSLKLSGISRAVTCTLLMLQTFQA